MSSIVLKANGIVHSGWKSITVQRSLEQLADTFSLTLSERWADNDRPRSIKVGSPCEIVIDDEKVITGYVDDVYPNYDAETHDIEIVGRSALGDLVDCSLEDDKLNQLKDQTLDQLARRVCKPFGIEVIVATDLGKPFKSPTIEAGQSPFEFLEQYARSRAVRMVSDRDGNLVLTRTGTERIRTSLELGKNILIASGEFTLRDRFDKYTILGQGAGGDLGFGPSTSESKGTSTDSRVPRHRPMVSTAEGSVNNDDLKKRAQWERNTRFGRSQAIVYTVLGWRHADGLWQPNTLVPVKDHYLDIDGDRLIVGVQFIMDEDGQRTELQVMPEEAFDLIELPEPDADDGGFAL
jgi:prophage tail gpP-like protein